MIEQAQTLSECCNVPVVFFDIKRTENNTIGLYVCPKCRGVYEF